MQILKNRGDYYFQMQILKNRGETKQARKKKG